MTQDAAIDRATRLARLDDLLYRLTIAWRGPAYWHWRYYGNQYRAQRDGGIWRVDIDGHQFEARSLEAWLQPGGTVHILLSGPSVRQLPDPSRLLQHPTITVNGSYRILQSAGQRADLYLLSDVGFVRRQWETVSQGIASARALAVDHRVLLEIIRRDPQVAHRVPIYLFDNLTRPYGRSSAWWRQPPSSLPRDGRRCAFSMQPSLGFFPSCTVAYLALQIAAAQKPRRIVLFGLDLNGGARYYAEQNAERSMLLDDFERSIMPDFAFSAGVLKQAQIEVINASPASALPNSIFPHADPLSCL